MHIHEAEKKDWEEWDKFNSKCECGNVFQTSRFSEAMESCGMQVKLLAAENDRGALIGGAFYNIAFPKGIKSKMNTLIVPCGPVLKDNDDKATLGSLLDAISEKAKELGVVSVELRTPFIKHGETMSKHGFEYNSVATSCSFISKLGDRETAWTDLDKKTRNAIRKAEKERVVVSDAKGIDDVREMYRLHLSRTKDIREWVPLPDGFFEGIWKNFSPRKDAKFMIARYRGKPIAESIFLCFRDRMQYFNNASLKEYQHLNANSLLVWRAIEWAIGNGFKILDLYGTPCTDDESHPQHGLYKFKRGFGGNLTKEMQYYSKTISATKKFIFEKVGKKIALPIYKKIGY